MNQRFGKTTVFFAMFLFFASVTTSNSQEMSAKAQYRFDLSGATEAPKLGTMSAIGFPEEARLNGVEGVLIAEMTLDATGKVSDFVFLQSLPFGYEQAVRDAFGTLIFEPAKDSGEPVPVKLHLEYTVTLVFDELDRNITNPEIIEQPEAVYPESEKAAKREGKVTIPILFNKDGTLTITAVESTLPVPFGEAASEAAKKIKFKPGIHKKSMSPVSVKMKVVYNFKPS